MRAAPVLILGSTGQLGGELVAALGKSGEWKVRAFSHGDLELCDTAAVRSAVEKLKPGIIINATAWNHVDAAETDPAPAFALNTVAVASLARICREAGALLVHFSTDYVFDGKARHPYEETDLPSPVNLYGLSKLAGEEALRLLAPRHCIVRTCGLYGRFRSRQAKRNFVDAILERAASGQPLQVRIDLTCTPTSASELAGVVFQLLKSGAVGTFHATNRGSCTWHEFACEILHHRGIRREVLPLATTPSPHGASRPGWSVLSGVKLVATGISPMSPWQDALRAYLNQAPS
jgi:dTDP-4-dehydrorhamnose reductase